MEQPKQKHTFRNLLIIIAILVVIAAVVVIFMDQSNTGKEKSLDEARSLVSAGNYQGAIDAANVELDKDPKNVEALQIRMDCAQLMNNYQLAKDTCQELYEITEDTYYQIHSININYGNLSGNTLSGGRVLETANETFYVTYDSESGGGERPIYTYNLWSVSKESTESVLVDTGPDAFIGELQLWGNSVYFRTSQGLKRLDLYSKEVTDFAIDGVGQVAPGLYQSISQMTIFNGQIYFILTNIQDNYLTSNTVNKVNIDGHGLAEVVPYQETTSVGITVINSFFPLGDKVYYRTTNNTRYGFYCYINKEIQPIMESNAMDIIFADNQSNLYIVSTPDGSPAPQLFQVSMTDNSATPTPATPYNTEYGVNCDDTSVYYIAEGGLTQLDIASGASNPLGQAARPGAEGIEIYLTSGDIILEQTGNFSGSYQNRFSSLSRANLTKVKELFNGNTPI